MILLAIVVTSFLISQEFVLGTIKSAWVRPVTRSKWYTAKVYTAAVTTTELFVLVVVITVILAVTRLGFADLTEKGYVVHTAQDLTRRLVLTVGLTIWVLWAVTAFVAMLSGWFNNPGGSIAAGLGAGIIMMVLAAFPPVRPFLLSTYVSIPLEQMVAMTKGLPLPLEWNQLVWQTLTGAGAWMAAAYLLGQWTIRSKEITT
jgi:ABC-type transport system involved in multi-copper enzyme maturation permease subunit